MKSDSFELLLLPAYNRRYKTAEEVLADWNAGKDFKVRNGPYCSIRDLPVLKAIGVVRIITNPFSSDYDVVEV